MAIEFYIIVKNRSNIICLKGGIKQVEILKREFNPRVIGAGKGEK
jgi:hypothetical protein